MISQRLDWHRIDTDGRPPFNGTHKVLVYTEGYDYAGDSFFELPVSCFYMAEEDQPEMVSAVSHWCELPYPVK